MALSSASACFRCANNTRKASAEHTRKEPTKYFPTCAPLSDRIPNISAKKYRTKGVHPTGIIARASVLRGDICPALNRAHSNAFAGSLIKAESCVRSREHRQDVAGLSCSESTVVDREGGLS